MYLFSTFCGSLWVHTGSLVWSQFNVLMRARESSFKKKWQREHICSEMHASGFNYSSCSFTSFSNPQHLTYALLFVWNRPVLGPRHDNGAGIHWWTTGGISNIRSILDAGTCYPHGIHQRHVQSVHQTFRWRRRSTRKNSESASSKSSRSAIRVASAQDTVLLWWEKINAFCKWKRWNVKLCVSPDSSFLLVFSNELPCPKMHQPRKLLIHADW